MRITQNTIVDSIKTAVSMKQSEFAEMQMQLASGRRNLRRSDNTTETAEEMRLKETERETNRWSNNVIYAEGWSDITDSQLNTLNNYMSRVREISVEGNVGVWEDAAREDLASDIDNILEGIFDLSNAKYDGIPIFAGTDTGQDAFTATRDANGMITAVTYNGNDTAKSMQISESGSVDYSFYGAGADGVFGSTDEGVDVFQSLIDLRDQFRNGQQPTDAQLQAVYEAADHVTRKTIENGYKYNQLERLESRLSDQKLNHKLQRSALEDVDFASAAVELSQLQASYQASLQMVSTMNSLSIVNAI